MILCNYRIRAQLRSLNTAQPETKDVSTEFGLKLGDVCPFINAASETPRLGVNVTAKVGFDAVASPSADAYTATQPEAKGISTEFGVKLGAITSPLPAAMDQKETKGFGADVGINLGLRTATSTTDLPPNSTYCSKKGYCTDFSIKFGLSTSASAPNQHMKRRFGADFGVQFGLTTTVISPASLSTPAQLKTRRIGANLDLKSGFIIFKKYFNATNHPSDAGHPGKIESPTNMCH